MRESIRTFFHIPFILHCATVVKNCKTRHTHQQIKQQFFRWLWLFLVFFGCSVLACHRIYLFIFSYLFYLTYHWPLLLLLSSYSIRLAIRWTHTITWPKHSQNHLQYNNLTSYTMPLQSKRFSLSLFLSFYCALSFHVNISRFSMLFLPEFNSVFYACIQKKNNCITLFSLHFWL